MQKFFVALATVGGVCLGAYGQSFVNGSLDGPTTAFSLVPAGRTNLPQGTSDTVSAAGHPFAGQTNIGPGWFADSNNGGTFVWSADFFGASGAQPEGIMQTVGGFTIGEEYRISFEYTNLGLYTTAGDISTAAFGSQNYASDGRWLISANGVEIGATDVVEFSPVGDTQVWRGITVDFIANAASIEFAFTADWIAGGSHVGMGIDGISVALVPAPGGALLLGAAGLFAGRRRR